MVEICREMQGCSLLFPCPAVSLPFTLQSPECKAFGEAIISFVNCALQVFRNSELNGLCVMLLSYTAQTKLLQNPPAEMDPGDVT